MVGGERGGRGREQGREKGQGRGRGQGRGQGQGEIISFRDFVGYTCVYEPKLNLKFYLYQNILLNRLSYFVSYITL